MNEPIRIFLSFDKADHALAEALAQHLHQAFPGREVLFWDGPNTAPEDYRRLATGFLEAAQLFLPLLSVNYLDKPDTRWELDKAVSEVRRRPGLNILTVLGRSAFVPQQLYGFPVAPAADEPIEKQGFNLDRQLHRVAEAARRILPSKTDVNAAKIGAPPTLPLTVPDLQERLLPMLDRVDFTPIFSLLKSIAYDAALLKDLFEAEDAFSNLYQQTRGMKTSLPDFLAKKEYYRKQLRKIIDQLQEPELVTGWIGLFIHDYFSFQPVRRPPAIPYFFIPTEEITVPETLNLPNSGQDNTGNIGVLSHQQKLDFRRNLLLAQDAIAVENYERAYAHCEHVRSHLDPQSAQLYEYLLITYVHKDKPEHVIEDVLFHEGRALNHVTLFTGRLRLNQEESKCPSVTGAYNRRVAAEILSDGMRNVYDAWPNDAVLDTGRHAETAAPNREAARRFIEAAQLVYRAVHPMRGAFRLLVNELCGGGKFHWVSKIVFAGEEIRFLSNESFDLESQIEELLELIYSVDEDFPEKQEQQRSILRENLYFSLLAKRQLLARQVAEEKRTNKRFTDIHESVIRFVHAALLGHRIFGDASQDGKDQSFLRLALEYLLPDLVLTPDPDVLLPDLRWFDLDAAGELCAHADSTRYAFDARAVIEKIVHDHAGKAGWLQISPNLKEEVYRQYVSDTEQLYEGIRFGLSWTDFRRMGDLDARKSAILWLRRQMVAYRAYPEQGQDFLDQSIRELIGDGLQNWLMHNPYELVSVPDSLSFGYDARAELKNLLSLSTRFTEQDLRQTIAENLFQKRIAPAYELVKRGDQAQRALVVRLLLEALEGYRLYPDPRYLDFVFRELTEEVKFTWLDIDAKSEAFNLPFDSPLPFDALTVLQELYKAAPRVYKPFLVRERIAQRRNHDLTEHYFHEISEFRYENRRPERAVAIEIIRKMKAIFRYMPREEYLGLPLRELSGRGRIRWHALFLGFFPTRENHFENQYFRFDYKFELYDVKRMLDNRFEDMQRVLRETGELNDGL